MARLKAFLVCLVACFVFASGAAMAAKSAHGLLSFDPTSVSSITITQAKDSGISAQTYAKQGESWVADGKSVQGVDIFIALLSTMWADSIASDSDEFGFSPKPGGWNVSAQLRDGSSISVEFGGRYQEQKNGWFYVLYNYARVGHGPVLLVGEFDMKKLYETMEAIK